MCMSPMIKSVLRDEFNFTARPENYVVTDSGALDFMVSRFHRFNDTGEDAAVAAMHAGVDLNSGDVYSKLSLALNDSRVEMDQIDTALTRLFHARMSLGLFDNASTIAYSDLGADDIFSGPHKR
jgi:beta-glucosidase